MEENKNVNIQNAENQAEATAITNEPVIDQINTEAEEKAVPEAVIEVSVPIPVQEPEPLKESAHDDFDWTVDKRN
ncbi:MAG: 30S ribosomal protein S1, partial [Chitinophagaceae bacterium]